jgi:hypothetical protein
MPSGETSDEKPPEAFLVRNLDTGAVTRLDHADSILTAEELVAVAAAVAAVRRSSGGNLLQSASSETASAAPARSPTLPVALQMQQRRQEMKKQKAVARAGARQASQQESKCEQPDPPSVSPTATLAAPVQPQQEQYDPPARVIGDADDDEERLHNANACATRSLASSWTCVSVA